MTLRPVHNHVPAVLHFGPLAIGDKTVDSAVLDDHRRVLIASRFGQFIGYNSKSSTQIDGPLNFPRFMRRKGVCEHLEAVLSDPSNQPFWVDVPQEFGRVNRAVAFPATLLPDICWGFVRAYFAGDLHPSQHHIAERCMQLLQALTGVAIIALVDEATGFQRERKDGDLQALLLERLVKPDRQEWAKRYSDQFFELLYAVYEIPGDPLSHHRPGFVGTLINFLVYDRIAPGLTAELQRLNEDRAARHHQYLSDQGLLELQTHLELLVRMMQLATDRYDFEDRLALVLPRSAEQLGFRFRLIDSSEFSGAKAKG